MHQLLEGTNGLTGTVEQMWAARPQNKLQAEKCALLDVVHRDVPLFGHPVVCPHRTFVFLVEERPKILVLGA